MLSTAAPLSAQPTSGSGNQADVSHWNSTCWPRSTATSPPLILTVPLSEEHTETQRWVWHKILTHIRSDTKTSTKLLPSVLTYFLTYLFTHCTYLQYTIYCCRLWHLSQEDIVKTLQLFPFIHNQFCLRSFSIAFVSYLYFLHTYNFPFMFPDCCLLMKRAMCLLQS